MFDELFSIGANLKAGGCLNSIYSKLYPYSDAFSVRCYLCCRCLCRRLLHRRCLPLPLLPPPAAAPAAAAPATAASAAAAPAAAASTALDLAE